MQYDSEDQLGFNRKIQTTIMTELLLRYAWDVSMTGFNSPYDSSTIVSMAIEYINDHFTDQTLSVDEISSRFFVSNAYLSKLFKKYAGVTVWQFIIKKRLFYSQTLLKEGYSVLNACLECGFKDYTSYLKAFRHNYFCTPKAFQKAMSSRAND